MTNALENLKQKGHKFVPGKVDEWMDCGNKEITVETNSRILQLALMDKTSLVSDSVKLKIQKLLSPVILEKMLF